MSDNGDRQLTLPVRDDHPEASDETLSANATSVDVEAPTPALPEAAADTKPSLFKRKRTRAPRKKVEPALDAQAPVEPPPAPEADARPGGAFRSSEAIDLPPLVPLTMSEGLSGTDAPPARHRRWGWPAAALLVVAGVAVMMHDRAGEATATGTQPAPVATAPLPRAEAPRAEAALPGPPQGDDAPASRVEILEIQAYLAALKFYAGEPDGLANTATVEAIREFQYVADMPVDGRPTRGLLNLLRTASP